MHVRYTDKGSAWQVDLEGRRIGWVRMEAGSWEYNGHLGSINLTGNWAGPYASRALATAELIYRVTGYKVSACA